MLRTRTNDTVEILELTKENLVWNSQMKMFELHGITKDDLLKYNIIFIKGSITYGDGRNVQEGYYYLNQSNQFVTCFGGTFYELGTTYGIYMAYYIKEAVTSGDFEDLVEATPTDVRLVEDQGKLQLQLEHDSQVLSIDEGVNDLLNDNFCSYTNVTSDGRIFVNTNNKILFGEEDELLQINDISTINTLFGEDILTAGGGRYTMIVASKIEYQGHASAKLCVMDFTKSGSSITVNGIHEISNKVFFVAETNLFFIKLGIVINADTTLKVIEHQNYGLVSVS